MTDIHGTCHDDFSAVRDAFQANFTERGDLGASVALSAAANLGSAFGVNRMEADLLGDMRRFSILQGAYASIA